MQTVSEYLEQSNLDQRQEYERIRKIVYELVPDAIETMVYGVPTFKYKGKNLLHFGAFTHHMSLFPGPHAIEVLQGKLGPYKIARGTIKYTNQHLIPKAIIIELLTVGKADIDASS